MRYRLTPSHSLRYIVCHTMVSKGATFALHIRVGDVTNLYPCTVTHIIRYRRDRSGD